MNAHLQIHILRARDERALVQAGTLRHPVAARPMALCACTFVLGIVLAATLLRPALAIAASMQVRPHQGHERLTIVLDAAPSLYNLLRDSRTSLQLSLPADAWAGGRKPKTLQPGAGAGKLVKRVEASDQGVRIQLASPSFGFIHQLDDKTLTIDLFADPLGAKWEPTPATTPPAPQNATVSPAVNATAASTQNATATPAATPAANATTNATASPSTRSPIKPAADPGPGVFTPDSPQASNASQTAAPPTAPPVAPPAVTAPISTPPATTPVVTPPATTPVVTPPASMPPAAAPHTPAIPDAASSATRDAWKLRAPIQRRQFGDPAPNGASGNAPKVSGAVTQPATPAPQFPTTPATPPVPATAAAPSETPPPSASSTQPAPTPVSPAPPQDVASSAQAPAAAPPAEHGAHATAEEEEDDGWLMTPDEALKALTPPEVKEGEGNASKPFVPNFTGILNSARAAMVNGDYDAAILLLEALRVHPQLPKKHVEEVLYSLADSHFAKAKEDYRTHYDTLTTLLTAAMNQNPKSSRTPEALLKLGLINLRVGNTPEAEAYFGVLLREFPHDPSVPLVYYYQGKNFFDKGQFQEAADKFQYIVQQYPDSRHVREAAVGLAEALYKLDYSDQALQIVDYIEKRWPRFYVEYPPILKLTGEVAARNKAWDRARVNYWTYYNLDPEGDDADIILARIGDVYTGQNSTAAARETYQQCVTRYPDKDGGLIALMRLAENGVHDTPSVQEMFSVFDRPFSTNPADIYERILKDHADSNLAPLARLKLAMWRLFNDQEREALNDVEAFLKAWPEHELLPQAMEVAGQAFQNVIAQHIGQENYAGIVLLCDEHPAIAKELAKLPPTTQTAMALAFLKTGQPARALTILEPLLKRPGMPEQSEMALQLATTIHLDARAWDKIVALHEVVQDWELSPKVKDEFDYALALAYENLQSPEKSQAIWQELADKKDLGMNRIAYTKYFLAMEARKRQDLKTAWDHGLDALTNFLETGEDPGKVMDLMQLLMDVADAAGRPRDALKWAIEYGKRLDPNDSRWPAMRYRTALLYKKVQDVGQWRAILEELATQMPTSPFGRMAVMDLNGAKIEEGVSQYTPAPAL